MSNKRRWIFIVITFFLIDGYFIGEYVFKVPELHDKISTVLALIAAAAFWLEFRRDKRLNEAKFLIDLNNQFIGNNEMTKVEHALELYADQVRKGEPSPSLNMDLRIDSKDRQPLINYLVHLEGIAALVNSSLMDISNIENLLAYRFFLAVNNPVVQEHELKPFSEYYTGIYLLHKKWTKRWEDKGRTIPLGNSPLNQAWFEESKKIAAEHKMKAKGKRREKP